MRRRTLTNKDKEEIGLQCCNCGSTEDLQYHHIIPIAIGGKDINSNICCLCYSCHYKLHHGKNPHVKNFSELIKEGQQKSDKKSGRKTGNLDKLTPKIDKIIKEYVDINPTLNRFFNQQEYLQKTGLSINTFKKYCRLEKERRDKNVNNNSRI